MVDRIAIAGVTMTTSIPRQVQIVNPEIAVAAVSTREFQHGKTRSPGAAEIAETTIVKTSMC